MRVSANRPKYPVASDMHRETAVFPSARPEIDMGYRYGLDTRSSLRLFFVYWTVFFALLLGAIALAVLDALVTMVKFRKEHMELRKTTRHSPHGGKRNDP